MRRAIGWGGLCYLIVAACLIIALLAHALPASDVQAWVLIVLAVGGLARLGYRMRGYQKPQAVRSYQEVLPPLLASGREFCLVLRPFGQDGETFLGAYRQSRRNRHRPDRLAVYNHVLTVEQVIARASRQALQLDTFAFVDQNRELAPPGPVYLRAPNERWQEAIHPLIQRAHSIILWLAPGQDLRESFHWEVEQIVRARRQFQTIVMLPPPDQNAEVYRQAVGAASVLLAALASDTGNVADADPARVDDYRETLDGNTLMATFQPSAEAGSPVLRRMYWTHPRKWWGGKMRIDAFSYERGLALLIDRSEEKRAEGPSETRIL